MRQTVLTVVKVVGAVAALLVLLLVIASVMLNSKAVQNRLMKHTTQMLAETLDTYVAIDSVYVDFIGQCLHVYGLAVDDREQRPMLRVKELTADVKLLPLLHRQVIIDHAMLSGAEVLLLKPSADEPANFQFVVDAFKKDTTANHTDTVTAKKGKPMSLDISRLQLRDIHTRYNDMEISLHEALYSKAWLGSKASLRVDSLHFVNDNHRPRKNAGKPKRGYFDPGHLDVTANLLLNIYHADKDSIAAELMTCQATDPVSGIDIRGMHTLINATKRRARLSDLTVRQAATVLHVAGAEVELPDRKAGRKLAYRADSITGSVVLRDISRPFAPVLANFKLPLNLSLAMTGTDSTMQFRNVRVSTQDKRLQIRASGRILNLKKARNLNIHFDVERMTAKQGIKSKVIGQFPVKKFMMTQLHRLGDISYRGSFDVLWKKELFRGDLQTAGGPVTFHMTIDNLRKYVSGSVSTQNFELGKVMDMKQIGGIACSANFTIDISKPRTAAMRRQLGGKLPIGKVDAVVDDCNFKKIHVRNLSVSMVSNGAEVTGDLIQEGKRRDLSCSFSFTNTDEMQKMKILKPRIKFHKRLDDTQDDSDDKPKKGSFLKRLFSKKKHTEE